MVEIYFAMRRILYPSAVYFVCSVSCFATGTDDVTSGNRVIARNPAFIVTTCNTPSCKRIASRLLGSIDDAVDPCDNFYQYTCGKWPQNHPIPANKPGVNEVWELEDKIAQVVIALLQDGTAEASPLERKLKRLYNQCMDEAQRNRLRANPLFALLEYSLGGWPILTPNWNSSNFSPLDALFKSFLAGSEPFFFVEANDKATSPQLHVITIKDPATYAQSDVLKDRVLGKLHSESYKQFLFNATAVLLRDMNNTAINTSMLSAKLMDIFNIERNISLERVPTNGGGNPKYRQQFTLSELEARSPFNSSILRNLTTLIRSCIAAAGAAIPVHENNNLTVEVNNFPLMSELDNLFVQFEQGGVDGMERLANYIGWHIIKTHAHRLSKDYLASSWQNYANVNGIPGKSGASMGMVCFMDVRKAMPFAVGALYVKHELPRKSIQQATILVKNVQAGFGQLLELAAKIWLDNSTYKAAVRKLSSLIIEVGYPRAVLLNTSVLDEHYKDIRVEDNYLKSMLTVERSLKFRNLRRLTKPGQRDDPLNQDEWLSDVTMVQAHNDFNRNRLVVNAALLNPPFFDPDGPQFANYGALGTIVGHEITHAFDGVASGFDDQGVRQNWWSVKAAKGLGDRIAGLMDDYYGCITEFGKVNEETTSAENVADNGGPRAAYEAFVRYLQHSTVPEQVPAQLVHYSPQQLFFLSAAMPLCNKYRPEFDRRDFLVNRHSPAECRVDWVMSNMLEFAQAFNCFAKSDWNAAYMLRVW